MNYNKAITFSAPDAPHLHWLPILAFHGITEWHGRRFDEPLTYLGYPLIHLTTYQPFFSVAFDC
jgi:hypothetical protein